MKKLLFILLVTSISFSKSYKVYFLGGQSNMDGLGKVSELPDSLNKTLPDVYIFHGISVDDHELNGGLGMWSNLKPGHGYKFSSNGSENSYGNLFGVELTFADELKRLTPNDNIAIIKYSKSGASIDTASRRYGCFEPDFRIGNGINQYDNLLNTINNAFLENDIDHDGEPDTLLPAGIIWMQGESDAYSYKESAVKYEYNLTRLIFGIRSALRDDDLPVVIGRISESGRDDDGIIWTFGDIVRHEQEAFVKHDVNAYLIKDTDNYNYSDKYHYDSEGYIDLGKKFARAVIKLTEKK